MSSAVLYLAIVAVWAIVLVPMWLRRDSGQKREEETTEAQPAEAPAEHAQPAEAAPAEAVPRPRPSRATIIARRRRRTAGLTLLALTAVVVAAAGLAPWWTVPLPAALLTGHLALLRVAVRMDAAARTRTRAAAAAAARARAREAAAGPAPAPAEVIELITPQDVFDQYADDRRAVGE
ncbi:hypothetical protein [Spirillospora albida]|uniref:divisome protein SepX/GlpR n=1 Tax=Spirillospora albida TaxID=58123 RepID=UPI0004C167FD|nr:hypothetical protein [Spirillospora albida]